MRTIDHSTRGWRPWLSHVAAPRLEVRLVDVDQAQPWDSSGHFFAGLTVEEAGNTLGISRATAFREWTFARAWLATVLGKNSQES